MLLDTGVRMGDRGLDFVISKVRTMMVPMATTTMKSNGTICQVF